MRGLSTIVAGFVVGMALAVPTSAQTLAKTLVDAYNHSGLLEQNRAVLRAADEDVAIALSALRPVIEWSSDITYSFGQRRSASTGGAVANFAGTTASIGISASITLYDYGQSRFAIEGAKESVLAARQALLSVEQQVLLNAVAAHMEIRRATETVALRQSNVRLITEELRAAKDRFEVGEVTRTDVALAEARLAAARSGLAAAQGDYAVAIEAYRAAVGHKPVNPVAPAKLPNLPTQSKAQAIALSRHPDLVRIQHQVTAAELNVARAEAAMKPKVTLRGGYELEETMESNFYSHGGSIALGASGPIYSGGRLSALARQSVAALDQTRANLHVVKHSILQNLGNAYARLGVASASREASARQVTASRVAFRGVREEATLGARTTLDVLDAEQELLDAQAQLISATVDEQIAAYQVLGTLGLLTAEHLNLGVQQFDPVAYYNMVQKGPAKRSKQGKELDRVLRALGKQ